MSAAPAGAEDAAVRVVMKPAKTEGTGGEAFTLALQAEGPEGTTYAFPAELVQEGIELHAVTAAGSGAPSGPLPSGGTPSPETPNAQAYVGAVFGLGEVEIPPLAVRYRLPGGGEGASHT